MIQQKNETPSSFQGLLADLIPGQLQSWELLEVLPLFLDGQRASKISFVSPLEHLKLVRVPTYGTIELENESGQGPLIIPMHIGFFQSGAQNHATSRALVLQPGETLTVTDAFCIQASQGGFLQEAQQRFITLPLGLRKEALALRGQADFSRLWTNIDTFNRRYGIARGGHLERFLRPYFHRLMRFRHAIELLPGQVGAAYFVAGNLVGVEVGPNEEFWQGVGSILNIYTYGAAALLGERHRMQPQRQKVDLENVHCLDELEQRLNEARQQELSERVDLVYALSNLTWKQGNSEQMAGLSIVDLEQGEWVGQSVQDGDETL
ncbi:MAG TPA: hypothetical protein VFN35_32380, partial [Ktedonobacteraceae bacterium]|nr:hypothetical protein [Ktedonobacteraceae bacterium]